MILHRIATAVAGSLLVLGAVTACGGGADDEADGSGDYCADLEQARDDFAGLQQGDSDAFDQVLERMQALRDAAPDEVADDWDTFTGAIEDFTGALDDAGLEVEDLSDPAAQQQLDAATREALQKAATALGSTEVTDAQAAIEEHASSACDVDLDAGGG